MSIYIGKQTELMAERYLVTQGLTLIARNYCCKMGEIDLIMRHEHTLVFVEVRHRASAQFGGAEASVTISKQRKIWRTAEHFLYKKRNGFEGDFRFDVLALNGRKKDIHWIKNAFNNLD